VSVNVAEGIIDDRYELQRLLGEGASGRVYLAHDRRLERRLALKLLHEQLADDEDQLQRFRWEATTVASLNHPNVVHVYDFGLEPVTYIAMELVEGRSLAAALARQGPMELDRALGIIEQVLAALAYAHRMGVVHRDVKPGNIMLSEGGRVKLTDFGIARLAGRPGLTETGLVVGTASYLSPEQAEGRPATGSSDLYAVGTVLFEILAGRPPFAGETPVAVALQHVRAPVPRLREVRPELPASIDSVLARALAKRPEDRFADAQSFLQALTQTRADAVTAVFGQMGAGRRGAGGRPPAGSGYTEPTSARPTRVRSAAGRGERLRPTPAPAGAPSPGGDASGRRWGRTVALVLSVLVLAGAAVVALALTLGDPRGGSAPDGTADDQTAEEGPQATSPADAPSEAETPATDAPATAPPETGPPETGPPVTAPPADPPGQNGPPGQEGREGEEETPDTVLGVSVGEPVEVTSFGATIRLPSGWQVRGFRSTDTLGTFLASRPQGASVRVDENLAWDGGRVDLEPDARRLEADLYERYDDMETISMERTDHRGARALRWEFVHSAGGERLHKVDLFFQRDGDTPPAAILVTWPEGAAQAEQEARAVLETLEF
jgi:eukaryotic-like serine/threonine-protein kinase